MTAGRYCDLAPYFQGMIEVSDFTVRFLADPPGKTPLLLVHGFLSSRNHWLLNLEQLRQRFRIVIAELPGHGDTPGSMNPNALTPDALVSAFELAREALGIPRWHICGQSFGAALTLRYALHHPERISAQVWTNANRVMSPPWTEVEYARHRKRRDALATEGVVALRREPFHPRYAKRFPRDIRAVLAHDADRCDIPTIVALLDYATPRLSLRSQLWSMSVPTFLINGRHERAFQDARRLVMQLVPNMQVTDLDGGHSINIEAPHAFNTEVMSFLSNHD